MYNLDRENPVKYRKPGEAMYFSLGCFPVTFKIEEIYRPGATVKVGGSYILNCKD